MKVLLDTNIIIDRESHNTKNFTISTLYKWIDRLHYNKCIHPSTIDEINRYNNEELKNVLLIKINCYSILTPASSGEDVNFTRVCSQYSINTNSLVDNELLYQVYIDRVDVLITEDKKMHKKAHDLGIASKVYTINRFITDVSNRYPDLVDYKVLAIRKQRFGEVDYKDVFFDTFRRNYVSFNKWFNGKCDEEAYVCKINQQIVGFLYLKIEELNHNYSDIIPTFACKKRLKIGTFKVESTGFRLGERFLKIIFDNAVINKVDEIYVTMFDDNLDVSRLKELLERWGFTNWGEKHSQSGVEKVLIKQLMEYDINKTPKENYPLFLNESQKFILPIYPSYHIRLFPDAILRNENMDLIKGNKSHEYALLKVYVSSADCSAVRRGDIVMIYRTGNEGTVKKYTSVLTTICIVDSIVNSNSLNSFLEHCENRSVFTTDELKDLFPKFNKIIKLIFLKTLIKRVTLNELQSLGIVEVNQGPRPFTLLTNDQFQTILSLSNTPL